MPTPRQIAADPLKTLHINSPPSRAGTILPVEDAAAVETRMAEWRDAFRPTSAEEKWLFEQVVVNSVRVDGCQRLETELRTQLAVRASVSWDEDRRLDAEKTASTLSRYPARVTRKLLKTKQGCEWLLDRWHFLASALGDGGTWTKAQHALALNLLGTPPEFRDDPPRQSPSEMVSEEIARLERLNADSLDELDGHERAAAEIGLEIEPGEALTRLQRYEAACMRRYQWARNQLRGRRGSASVAEESPPPPPAPLFVPPQRAMTDDDWREYERQALQRGFEKFIAKHSEPPHEPEPEPEPQPEREPESPAVETTLDVVPAISDPTPTALPPVSLNNTTPSLLPLGNRKTRRAVEKMARQRALV